MCYGDCTRSGYMARGLYPLRVHGRERCAYDWEIPRTNPYRRVAFRYAVTEHSCRTNPVPSGIFASSRPVSVGFRCAVTAHSGQEGPEVPSWRGRASGSDPITFGGALFWRGASRFPSDDAVWWKRTALTDQCLAARTLSLTAYRFLAAAPGATTGISRRVSPDKPRTAQTGLSAIQGASLHVAGL